MGRMLIIAITVSVLQLTAIVYTKAGPPIFNLPLIFLVFISLRKGFLSGVVLGVFFGVFNGFFNLGPFWANIFLYTLIGSVIGYIGQWFYRENLLTFILMVFCSELFIYFSYCIMRTGSLEAQLNVPDCVFRLVLPALFYNVVASVFLFYLLKEIEL